MFPPACPKGPVRAALATLDAYLRYHSNETWVPYAAINRVRVPRGSTFRGAVLNSPHWAEGLAWRGLERQSRGENRGGVARVSAG